MKKRAAQSANIQWLPSRAHPTECPPFLFKWYATTARATAVRQISHVKKHMNRLAWALQSHNDDYISRLKYLLENDAHFKSRLFLS